MEHKVLGIASKYWIRKAHRYLCFWPTGDENFQREQVCDMVGQCGQYGGYRARISAFVQGIQNYDALGEGITDQGQGLHNQFIKLILCAGIDNVWIRFDYT